MYEKARGKGGTLPALRLQAFDLGAPFGVAERYVEQMDGYLLFENDIIVYPEQQAASTAPPRSGSASNGIGTSTQPLVVAVDRLWPNGVVPYEIGPEIPTQALPEIDGAINHWNTMTNVTFQRAEGSDVEKVQFVASSITGACSSAVGRRKGAPQEILLPLAYSPTTEGGEDWGSSAWTTGVAFGNVDNDSELEMAVSRHAGSNLRVVVYDLNPLRDGSYELEEIKSFGSNWGSGTHATDVAFGDVDGDGRDELGITRVANKNMRAQIFDDANAKFASLKEFGRNWGSGNHGTAIAFGNVDGDPALEVAIGRRSNVNMRVQVFDDASTGFASLKEIGTNWGSGTHATDVAFGDVDGDGRDELGITRVANKNMRAQIFDDANAKFASLKEFGRNWGSGTHATAIAFGNVDGDPALEVAIGRRSNVNMRVQVFDDASTGFASLKEIGTNWGSGTHATDVAFGDVDGDGRDELGITRVANKNMRAQIFDDANAKFASLKEFGRNWGSGTHATAIAFGNVDGDPALEVAIGRRSNVNMRVQVFDDAATRFRSLKEIGRNWGSGNHGTAIAFGNVDADLAHEVAVTRFADSKARAIIYDDLDARTTFRQTTIRTRNPGDTINPGNVLSPGDIAGINSIYP